MPRRRQGQLLALEIGILIVCSRSGAKGAHGFAIAKALADLGDTRSLTATGTLYRALHRLEQSGMVESSWEDPEVAADENRPRRRTYRITGDGVIALVAAPTLAPAETGALRIRPEPAP